MFREAWTGAPDGTDAEFSILAVLEPSGSQTTGVAAWWSLVGAGRVAGDLKVNGSATVLDFFRTDPSNGTQDFSGLTDVSTGKHVFAWRYSPGQMRLTVDGTTAPPDTGLTTLGALNPEMLLVGADSGFANVFLNANVAEVAVIPRAINDAELANYDSYAQAEWGGLSLCAPNCAGKACGADNGCGGTCDCGACTGDTDCSPGFACNATTGNCGDPLGGSSGTGGTGGTGGTSVSCTTDANCPPDVHCNAGYCGQSGASCGTCASGYSCANGICQCAPTCANKACGDADGCGGTCGCNIGDKCRYAADCPDNAICFAGACVPPECLEFPQLLGCGTPTSVCGPSCTPHPICTSDADCGTGYYCPLNNGWRFGVRGQRVCQIHECDTEPKVAGCGDVFSECGICYCEPQCQNKHCGDPDLSDGCGGRCTNLCEIGQGVCIIDSDCSAGGVCRGGLCRPAQPCANLNVKPPDCGSSDSTCGPCLTPPPESSGRQCGIDPNTQTSIGSCAAGLRCTAEGQCVPVTQTPPIQFTATSGTARTLIPPASPPAVPGVGGIPGKFAVSDRGSATYTIPIDVPPGGPITPSLSFRYASSSGNGALGIGWSLDGLSTISRCQQTFAQDGFVVPVTGTDSDPLCLDGQRLIPVNDQTHGLVYYTQIDTFNQVRPGFSAGNEGHAIPDYFKVYAKDGRILTYGLTGTSYLPNGQVGAWSLTQVEDRAGNFMTIEYNNFHPADENGVISTSEILPAGITYGGHNGTEGDRLIEFFYDTNRVDSMWGFRAPGGTLFSRSYRLTGVQLSAGGSVVRSYQLGYDETRGVSRLTSIQECASSVNLCKPATTFEYNDETGFEDPQNVVVDAEEAGDGTQGTNPDIINGIGAYGYSLQESGKDHLGTATVITTVDTGLVSFFQTIGIGVSILTLGSGSEIAIAASAAASGATTIAGMDVAHNQYVPIDLQLWGGTGDINPDVLHMEYAVLPTVNCLAPERLPQVDAPLAGDPNESLVNICPQVRVPTGKSVPVYYSDENGEQKYDLEAQFANYLPREWFLDVDGDGLQDELQCGSNRNQQTDTSSISVVFATKSGTTVHIPGQHEPNVDSWVPAFSDMCAAFCNNQEQFCTAVTPFTTLLDVNGDGTPDLVAADSQEHLAALLFSKDPTCGTDPTCHKVIGTWHPEYFSDVTLAVNSRDYIVTMDVNGDGLRDLVGLPNTQIDPTRTTARVAYNTGAGFVEVPLAVGVGADATAPQFAPFVLDYDHDGFDDLLEPVSAEARQWRIRHFKNNTITVEQSTVTAGPGTMGDFDGDGNMDLLTGSKSDPVGTMHLSRGRGRRDHLLKRVIDGMGRYVSISYDGTPNLGQPDDPASGAWDLGLYNLGPTSHWTPGWPIRVVDVGKTDHALVSEDVEGHYTTRAHDDTQQFQTDRVFDYGYSEWANDVAGYGPLGFSSRLVVERDGESNEIGRQLIEYNLTGPDSTDGPYMRLYTGLPAKITALGGTVAETTTTSAYAPRTETTFGWNQQTSYAGLPFPYLQTRTTLAGLNSRITKPSSLDQLTERDETKNVDQFGNTSHSEVEGTDISQTAVDTDFTPDSTQLDDWLISLPHTEDATSSAPDCGFNCSYSSRHRHNDYTYYPDTNLLWTFHRAAGGSSLDVNVDRTTTLGRDPAGHINQIVNTDLLGNRREVDVQYDDRELFPITITRVGQTLQNQITQVRYDDRFGTLEAQMDPNGIDETWSYDDFGILRLHHGPNGDESVDYATDDYYSVQQPQEGIFANFKVTASKAGGSTVVSEYNNLGQLVRLQTTGLQGAAVFQELDYDWRNRLSRVFRPHLDSITSQGADMYLYDAEDRVVEHIGADEQSTYYYYGVKDASKSELPAGVITSTIRVDAKLHDFAEGFDGDGRLVMADDGDGSDPVQENTPMRTYYVYGAFSELADITLAQEAAPLLDLTRDDYGRVVWSNRPDAGTYSGSHTYDGLDELIQSFDATGQRSFSYDDFGRLAEIDDADGAAKWTYDTDLTGSGGDTIGRLVQTVGPDLQTVNYGYMGPEAGGSNRGLLSNITEHLHSPEGSGSVDLSVDYTYDGFSRLSRIDYPAVAGSRFAVEYGFDSAGHVISAAQPADLRGPNDPALVYWQLLQHDQGVRIQSEQLGSTACGGAGVVTTRQYDPYMGRQKDIQSACGSALLQHLSYDYNETHSMIDRNDHVANRSETFDYDSIGRLEYVNGDVAIKYAGSFNDNAFSYQAGVGDYSPQSQLPVGDPDINNPYWTHQAGDATLYTHDATGDQVGRSGPGIQGGSQGIAYTTFDLPTEVIQGNGYVVDFSYTANHGRAVKSAKYGGSPAGVTFYMGDLFQRAEQPDGSATGRNMVYAGGRLVAVAAATDSDPTHPTLHYLHDDAIGSIQTITAADGSVEAARDFNVFGVERSGSDAHFIDVPYGFTGQEHDADLGLINMHGRIFDPVLGEFLSPDPVMPNPVGHDLNAFGYVGNQPLDLTDPSGFRPASTISDDGVFESPFAGGGGGDPAIYPPQGPMGTIATAESFQQGSLSVGGTTLGLIGLGVELAEVFMSKGNPHWSHEVPGPNGARAAGSTVPKGTNDPMDPGRLERGSTALQMPERLPNDCTMHPLMCLAEGPSNTEGRPGTVDEGTGGTGPRVDVPTPSVNDCEAGESDCLGAGLGTVATAALPYLLKVPPAAGLSTDELRAADALKTAVSEAPEIESTELTGITANKVVGDAAADELAESLRATGLTVEREVSYWTPIGKRVADLRVSGPEGVRGLIEVKTGSSAYTAEQQLKDLYISWKYRVITNVVRYP